MKYYKFTVIFIPEKEKGFEGYYNVSVPALPGCLTFGESLEEARFMAKDALACHLEGLIEDDERIPSDIRPKKTVKSAVIEEIIVAVDHQVKVDQFPHELRFALA